MSETSSHKGRLEFETEPGSSRSKWVAGGLTVALIGWMGSGYILPAPKDSENPSLKTQELKPVSVAIRSSSAQDVLEVFSSEGQAQPDRRTAIRAEASAQVASILARKGENLVQGQVIAHLSSRDLEAQLEQASEELDRAQRDFDNANTLLDRGVATADRVAEARATLATAKAQVAAAEKAFNNSHIRAPFSGRLNTLDLDEGEFVQAGTEIGTILDSDPLTVSIQVPQQSVSRIRAGQPAQVSFITGETREGFVSFVGVDADGETRTFPAEVEIANPGNKLPSGLSAQVQVPTGKLRAHFVSPAVLSLNEDGDLGVKTVDATNTVVFFPVIVERAQTDGIWVSGLPEKADIITVGQGFVRDGEMVAPKSIDVEDSENSVEAEARL
ncbi:efflux transporter periplasmic adaptor subunit (plasmid) [Salipiger sp. CCB-MM3]|nr:efflux transporter periplasmic adaptor subunit [Salipiger sp. CCB-MM3]